MAGVMAVCAAAWTGRASVASLDEEEPYIDSSNAARTSSYDANLGENWWMERHAAILERIEEEREFDLVLVGDSITHRWDREGHGAAAYATVTNSLKTLNLGFGADVTVNCLWRLRNGELDGYKAKVFHVLIGTNDGEDAEGTAANIRAVLREIRARHPEATILLCALLPRGELDDRVRLRNEAANAILKPLCDDAKIVWTDWSRLFTHSDGTMNRMYVGDGLHPNKEGFDRWRDAALPVWLRAAGKADGPVTGAAVAECVDAAIAMRRFDVVYFDGESHETWIGGAAGDWAAGGNWDAAAAPENHWYAHFTNSVAVAASSSIAATGLVAEEGAGAVSLRAPQGCHIMLRKNAGNPAVANLAAERFVLDIDVRFAWNGWGDAAVLPFVEYRRELYSNVNFVFLAGCPGAPDDINTSLLRAKAQFEGDVEIEVDHIVRVSGEGASFVTPGTLTVNGVLAIEGGATYSVGAIDPASRGLVTVNGKAVFGGGPDWNENAEQWGAPWNPPDWAQAEWTGGTGVERGKYYKLDGRGEAIRLNTPGESEVVFPGAALWCANGSAGAPAFLALKGRDNTVADLRLGDRGGLSFQTYNSNAGLGQVFRGAISVDAVAGAPAVLMGGNGYPNVLAASIVGTGALLLRPHTPANDDSQTFRVEFSGDNSGWTGRLALSNHGSVSNRTVLTVSDSAALGGEPGEFIADALTIRNSTLVVAGGVTQNAMRGLRLEGDVEIRVEEGCVFTVLSPVSVAEGTRFVKSGPGILDLGGKTIEVAQREVEGVVTNGRIAIPGETAVIDPANPEKVRIEAPDEAAAIDALRLVMPQTAPPSLAMDDYKDYFDFHCIPDGGGAFFVEYSGIKESCKAVTANAVLAALASNRRGESVPVAVCPGLFYGFGTGATPRIQPPSLEIATGTTREISLPSGSAGFVRIDIAAARP